MLHTKVEEIYNRVAAFYPVYTEFGSVTRIIYADAKTGAERTGDESRQVKSVIGTLARCYAVDLQAQAKLMREHFHKKSLHHFFLPDGGIFIPFKMRKKRVEGDCAYGYVELSNMEGLIEKDGPAVMLRSGTALPILCQMDTARLAYYFGKEIRDALGSTGNEDLGDVVAVLQRLFHNPRPVTKNRKLLRKGYKIKRAK